MVRPFPDFDNAYEPRALAAVHDRVTASHIDDSKPVPDTTVKRQKSTWTILKEDLPWD